MLENLIDALRSTSKPGKKLEIVQENSSDFLKLILKATFEPFKMYHVKLRPEDTPIPGEGSIDDTDKQLDLVALLDALELSNSSQQNRLRVIEFLRTLNKGSQELVIGVLNKNWKVGLSHKAVHKLYPGLVSNYEVQLANSYLKVIKKKSYQPKARWCSYKLDGVRCTFLRFSDGWKALSRQGKEFLTCDHLKDQLELLYAHNSIDFWDGELYVAGASFEYIQGLVTSFTTGTSYELEFRAFICGKKKDFLAQVCNADSFAIVGPIHVDYAIAPHIIEQTQWLIQEDEISEMLEKAFELGYEGIMLRDPDQLYDFKRSDALLKLKESESAQSQEMTTDCLIKEVIIDSFPVIINETMIYKQLLTRLVVEQENGLDCSVGSGFDLDFRHTITDNPELILNKVCEIKFQGYGSKGKMRFPRLFRVREDLTWRE